MSIKRAPRPESGYTLIRNETLRDVTMSYRARGVLGAVLSRPDDWETDSESLAKEGTEGRDAIRTALRELEDHGYVKRVKVQDEKGRWATVSMVYDEPQLDEPATVPPVADSQAPAADNPSPETDSQSSVNQPSVSQAVRRTTDTNNQEHSSSEMGSPTSPGPDDDPRPEVVELCEHLAAKIVINGGKAPTVGKRWHRACRLLIDVDGRTPDQIRRAIDWCQADAFWAANILSMPTLREKYDTLRLQALRTSAQPADRRQQATNDIFEQAKAWAANHQTSDQKVLSR